MRHSIDPDLLAEAMADGLADRHGRLLKDVVLRCRRCDVQMEFHSRGCQADTRMLEDVLSVAALDVYCPVCTRAIEEQHLRWQAIIR